MKFPQLAIGTRFRYQGKVYCKTSPMAASDADGNQRMIPRSAQIELLDEVAVDKGDGVTPRSPEQALAEHHALCRELLQQAAQVGDEGLPVLLQRLDAAYATLLTSVA